MQEKIADNGWDSKPAVKTRATRISTDGKWRSFPKVANLVQYVTTGNYFGRAKIDGKIFRESLETNVFTTAKLRLPDFIKKKRKRAAHPVAETFDETRARFEADTESDYTLRDGSKLYRRIGRVEASASEAATSHSSKN
jgi:hypothetical protein